MKKNSKRQRASTKTSNVRGVRRNRRVGPVAWLAKRLEVPEDASHATAAELVDALNLVGQVAATFLDLPRSKRKDVHTYAAMIVGLTAALVRDGRRENAELLRSVVLAVSAQSRAWLDLKQAHRQSRESEEVWAWMNSKEGRELVAARVMATAKARRATP